MFADWTGKIVVENTGAFLFSSNDPVPMLPDKKVQLVLTVFDLNIGACDVKRI